MIEVTAITSNLHNEMILAPSEEAFIKDVEKELGQDFIFTEVPSLKGGLLVFYVRTGGTEGIFKKWFDRVDASALPKVWLLTSGQSNSLAASMEILSFLNRNGLEGEILHGSAESIASAISSADSWQLCLQRNSARVARSGPSQNSLRPAAQNSSIPGPSPCPCPGSRGRSQQASICLRPEQKGLPAGTDRPAEGRLPKASHCGANKFVREFGDKYASESEHREFEGNAPQWKNELSHQNGGGVPQEAELPQSCEAPRRLGVVGHPSDWLISCKVDYEEAKKLGFELIDITMEEFMDQYNCLEDPTLAHKPYPLKPLCNPGESFKPKYGKALTGEDMDKSLRVYSALRRIAEQHNLDGLTLRCFDLLTSIGTTGCMGLAILNAEGITATCEGDIPAMLTMDLARTITGTSGFQVNLSRTDGDNHLFAHCTVPLNIVEDYQYDTHFESGIGVAVHGIFKPGPATLFKLGADLKHYVAEDVEIVENQYGNNLCRTQILVAGKGLGEYLLKTPLGNHHVIIPGKWASKIKEVLG